MAEAGSRRPFSWAAFRGAAVEEGSEIGYGAGEPFFEGDLGLPVEQLFGFGDVGAALRCPPAELQRLARRARQRTLEEHTGANRARQLLEILHGWTRPAAVEPPLATGTRR